MLENSNCKFNINIYRKIIYHKSETVHDRGRGLCVRDDRWIETKLLFSLIKWHVTEYD